MSKISIVLLLFIFIYPAGIICQENDDSKKSIGLLGGYGVSSPDSSILKLTEQTGIHGRLNKIDNEILFRH